jgi:multidrug efflux pump subunit AcrA (membrane-fusion protein)
VTNPILKIDKFVKRNSIRFWDFILSCRIVPHSKNSTISFLSDADRIEAEPINQNYPITLYTIIAVICAGLLWAAFSPLDQVVGAPGRVVSIEQNIVLQPQETAEIKEVFVTIGQNVQKGDLLFVLDPTVPQADLNALRGTYHGVLRSIEISNKEIKTIETRVLHAKELEEMTKQLVDKHFQSRRALIEQKEKSYELEQALLNAKSRNSDLQAQKSSHEQQLIKATRRSELIKISAPRNAVVLEVSSLTKGSIARAAEPLITLVPNDVPILAEVNIDPSNISGVKIGQRAKVKLDAFPFQRYGYIEGRIVAVTPDAIQNKAQNAKSSYLARIEFDRSPHAGQLSSKIIPGMTLIAEVVTDKRTILEYIFDPLLKIKMDALNEK